MDKYKEFFKKNGIELFFEMFCGRHNKKLYPESHSDEEIKIFGLENKPSVKMTQSKGKLCNAGYNACVVDSDGNASRCFGVHESLGNIYTGIRFKRSVIYCPCKHCGCPINCYNTHLFEKAMAEYMVG